MDPTVIEVLIAAGAELNEKDNSQQTALDKACNRGAPEIRQFIIKLLQANDARKANGGTSCGAFSVDKFLNAAQESDLAELSQQIEMGIDVNQTNVKGTNSTYACCPI